MWDKLEAFMPLFVVIAPIVGSYIGARLGRKQLLDQCSLALNEQGDEAIMQYKVIRALLTVIQKMVGALHDAKVLNGNSAPIEEELASIKNMMDTDIVERKKKSFYVKKVI